SPPLLFRHTPTTAIYPLSLHDALPIYHGVPGRCGGLPAVRASVQAAVAGSRRHAGGRRRTGSRDSRALHPGRTARTRAAFVLARSEEHTSELQSRRDLVCRLLLEKKKK